jgi:UDP-N-acetylglucosamine 4,6-dehydratase
MIPRDDARRTLEFDSYYLIQPDFRFWERRYVRNGAHTVPEDFEYSSDTNPWRLGVEEMREIVRCL